MVALPALTTATFDEAIAAQPDGRPLVVDFWAEWCPPCKALTPILEQLSRDLADTTDFAAVDTDAHPELAARYRALTLPTLLVFRDGEVVHRLVGLRGRNHLVEELARINEPVS
jgi:thioredoxin 1